ncbi:MAG: epoxyqueuosine reductase [Synergistaceae bacterium]|nr:epoxyqueuosine reductase [Synergistaceae bacterium]
MLNNINLSAQIHDAALQFGYESCGIIKLSDISGYRKYLDERIAKIPESKKIYGFYDAFDKLEANYPWAKAIVVCALWLGKYKFPASLEGKWGKYFILAPVTEPKSDAYKNMKLFEAWLSENNIKAESSPMLPLRHAAVYAGLGIFRKNNFFYGKNGSFYDLKAYLIDKECEYKNNCDIKPCAENCKLCQDACRTRALCAPYTMNPMLCLSFITTFGGGAVPDGFTEADMGSWICGCDDCQDVCPHNQDHDWSSGEDFCDYNYVSELEELLQPENILSASDETLINKVIPKTAQHIKPEDCNILRVDAARVLRVSKSN